MAIKPFLSRVFFIACVGLLALSVKGSTFKYAGILDPGNPNDIFSTQLHLPTRSNLMLRTFSYGGGTMHDGSIVPSGSFDPTLAVFRGIGPGAILPDVAFFNDDGTCPPANVDPNTLLCLDSILDLRNLSAGFYTIILTVSGNFPMAALAGSGTLGDGFTSGGFYDEPSVARYSLDVIVTPVPEPAAAALVASGIALAWIGVRAGRRITSVINPSGETVK